MRIAYLSVFYPYRGGISQFNAALYRALEKQHEVKAFNFKRLYPNFLFPGKSQFVENTDSADAITSQRVLDSINPLSFSKTINEIKKFKPDLLLIQNWMPFFAPSLGWVARYFKKLDIPTISIIANMKPHEPKPGDVLLSKFFLKHNHGFVVLADSVKNDLLELKPVAKIFYHPHPNYEHFGDKIEKATACYELGIPQDKKIILFFGLIRHYKGLDLLIEAMRNTPDDYFLLIAGEVYGDSSEYENLLSKNLPPERYKFINRYLKDNEVPKFFSAADVCVLPYRSATQSGIVGISYHFGVPVISTDVGGLREVIEPFHAGIVIDKPDSQLLHEAILRYFNDNLQENFSRNIHQFKAKYTWDSLAEGIVEFGSKFI
jgi:glycosyltransferase involved in cell wall biosynthesis